MPTTRRTMSLLGALAIAAITLGACSSGSNAAVSLDGSPRVPDAEGIVVKANANGITLKGHKPYAVSKKLVAFSTYTHQAISLASTVNDYVQVGLDGNTVVWLGRIGVVARDEAGHGTVSYQGNLVRTVGQRMEFKDGTVLQLAAGLQAPKDAKGSTYAVIDADKAVVQGATFAPITTSTTRPKKS